MDQDFEDGKDVKYEYYNCGALDVF